jgi:tetratricopeptide (TPR) repeat protein
LNSDVIQPGSFYAGKAVKALWAMSSGSSKLLIATWLLSSLVWGQQSTASWQDEVRRYAQAQNWAAAMQVVDHQVELAPRDMDVRAWRARIFAWSGQPEKAEHEYLEILGVTANDPDNWLGLANVYSRQGKTQDALRALDRAEELDPKRVDIRIARGKLLSAANQRHEAKLEFQEANRLEPGNTDAHTGLLSLRGESKHELRVGTDTDMFSFAGANQYRGMSLTSQWTPHWRTSVAGDFYQWAGTDAGKFGASLTGKSAQWGALTIGGAAAEDNGIIPKNEVFFDYDRGLKLSKSGPVRALEIVYGQHWYWYTTARILTLNGTAILYLPHDWTWSLGLIEARSQFSGTGAEWKPSGVSRLAFPIAHGETRRLGGNVFFATGTENFAQVDQIGQFSSQTYGGGLRFQFTARQDVTGYGAYQKRTNDRRETSFGLTYGLRF